jgi:Tol biopolymer transport system component
VCCARWTPDGRYIVYEKTSKDGVTSGSCQ